MSFFAHRRVGIGAAASRAAALLLALLLGASGSAARAESEEWRSETELKTAFLYQFTKYVEWPERKPAADPAEASRPFVITVAGESQILPQLQKLAAAKSVRGRPIVVRSGTGGEALRSSDVVLLLGGDEDLLDEVLQKTRDRPVLIVTDGDGFAHRGAVINFYKEGTKIRFEVNRKAAADRKLTISSQVLKLARLVE